MEVPRLRVSLPTDVVNSAVMGAFVELGYEKPTTEQKDAVFEFVKGRDVFVSLPTGAGKSLCFAVLPLAFNNLRRHLKNIGEQDLPFSSIAVIVSPLVSLMRDQVSTFQKRGLR